MTINTGTPAFMAPETMDDGERKPGERLGVAEYTTAVDVYSFGITLWAMVERQVPYHEIANVWAIPMHVKKGKRPMISDHHPSDLRHLMSSCWDADPQKRPSMTDIRSAIQRLREASR